MLDFEEMIKLVSEQTVVCIGDLMLDDFVYGEVSRISPEAPAPILAVTRNDLTVGGAGNVARNIAGLGARCVFIGVVGEDEASRTLMRALAAEPLIEPHLVVDPARPTTRKAVALSISSLVTLVSLRTTSPAQPFNASRKSAGLSLTRFSTRNPASRSGCSPESLTSSATKILF